MSKNKIILEEKKCPICDIIIRSDASIHDFCKLCGMGIPNTTNVPKIQSDDGKNYYFCCDVCFSVYKKNIDDQDKNKINYLKKEK